jgi:octaprenyl-diphosphate synthase
MKVVEARLAERMESPIGSIPQVGAHLLGAGGKRLRPLLAVLAARATARRWTTRSRSAAPPS